MTHKLSEQDAYQLILHLRACFGTLHRAEGPMHRYSGTEIPTADLIVALAGVQVGRPQVIKFYCKECGKEVDLQRDKIKDSSCYECSDCGHPHTGDQLLQHEFDPLAPPPAMVSTSELPLDPGGDELP